MNVIAATVNAAVCFNNKLWKITSDDVVTHKMPQNKKPFSICKLTKSKDLKNGVEKRWRRFSITKNKLSFKKI